MQMWDNFARFTARLAKVHVWFDNLTVYLEFYAVFSDTEPNKPCKQGRHWGRLFAAGGGGDILTRPAISRGVKRQNRNISLL